MAGYLSAVEAGARTRPKEAICSRKRNISNKGLYSGKMCYNSHREAASGAAFRLSAQDAAGAEKSLGGNGRETCVRRLARAIRCANRAGANARRRARARMQDTRAKRVPPPGDARPGAARTEWGGTERDGETICRNGTTELHGRHGEHDISRHMAKASRQNMTYHDTMRRVPVPVTAGFAAPPAGRAPDANRNGMCESGRLGAGSPGECSKAGPISTARAVQRRGRP